MLYILLYALLISKGFKHKDKEYIFITYPISIHIYIYIYKSFKFIHKMYPKSDKNNAKIIITNFTIQIADGGSIRVRSHLSWKEDRAKGGRSYTFEWVHLYKGRRGLLGFNYRNVCEARYSHTPKPRHSSRSHLSISS